MQLRPERRPQPMLKAFIPGSASEPRAAIIKLAASLAMTACSCWSQPNPGCVPGQGWLAQHNPSSDSTGLHDIDFPEVKATWWVTYIPLSASGIVVHGTFPAAREFSIGVYPQLLLGSNRIEPDPQTIVFLLDKDIVPDTGTNNPFLTGTALGTYTVQVVRAYKPKSPQPNTLYIGPVPDPIDQLIYRLYYATDPNDLAGSVPLPSVTFDGTALTNCPVSPIIVPEDATVWGRLDLEDFSGTVPPSNWGATNPPHWTLTYNSIPGVSGMVAIISREFLEGNTLLVVTVKRPTSPNNRAGVPPYTPSQVRFWTMAQKDPVSTGVVRSIADADSAFVGDQSVYVVCDPSLAPAASTLAMWGATWIPWGALEPQDFVYNPAKQPLTNADGVFYLGHLQYTQFSVDPSFTQGIYNVAQIAPSQQQAAMGAYWPQIGYCSVQSFVDLGAGCITPPAPVPTR